MKLTSNTLEETEINIKVAQLRDEAYKKLMVSTDFTKCGNSLQAVHKMFLSCWPVMHRLMTDNEVLLSDNAKVLKVYAELDEKYKLLVIEYEKLKEDLGIDVQEKGQEGT